MKGYLICTPTKTEKENRQVHVQQAFPFCTQDKFFWHAQENESGLSKIVFDNNLQQQKELSF